VTKPFGPRELVAVPRALLQIRARAPLRVKLIRTRNPGRAIVEEARERRSDLIYLSTEHAPSDERLLGPTTRYILAKRPCRVIVERGENGEAQLPAHLGPKASGVLLAKT
jgi:nucleotide-binding universal stress UspA family protein